MSEEDSKALNAVSSCRLSTFLVCLLTGPKEYLKYELCPSDENLSVGWGIPSFQRAL